jgi:2-hydroxychromene-2-carboxylate isomerase
MGDLIRLSERMEARRCRGENVPRRRASPRPRMVAEFFFDLGCPFTYLAAERLERVFDEVIWTPATAAALRRTTFGVDAAGVSDLRGAAEAEAARLRLPLIWPERWPSDVSAAMRLAAHAAEAGRGGAFVLAATRLAFCGGFELDDPEVLAEAAAAAGLGLEDSLRAARDQGRDGAMEAAGRRLLAVGADRLPAIRVGRCLHWGEARVGDAVTGARLERAAER